MVTVEFTKREAALDAGEDDDGTLVGAELDVAEVDVVELEGAVVVVVEVEVAGTLVGADEARVDEEVVVTAVVVVETTGGEV